MVKAKTHKGTDAYLTFIRSKKGGWNVSVFLLESVNRYDDFYISPSDCNCDIWEEVKSFALKHMSEIDKY